MPPQGHSPSNIGDRIVEVSGPEGTWRFSVDEYRRPTLLASRNGDGELADVPVPEWMDDVLARFDVRGVEA